MTEGEHGLIVACCVRAAELWSLGHEQQAERWFHGALEMVGKTDFVDIDEEATR